MVSPLLLFVAGTASVAVAGTMIYIATSSKSETRQETIDCVAGWEEGDCELGEATFEYVISTDGSGPGAVLCEAVHGKKEKKECTVIPGDCLGHWVKGREDKVKGYAYSTFKVDTPQQPGGKCPNLGVTKKEKLKVDCLVSGVVPLCKPGETEVMEVLTTTQHPLNGGDACRKRKVVFCETNSKCEGSWNQFSDCDMGTGLKTKTYTVSSPATGDGAKCPFGNGAKVTEPCPVPCVASWIEHPCDKSTGFEEKVFTVTQHEHNSGGACKDASGVEVAPGTTERTECPVNCKANLHDWESVCEPSSITGTIPEKEAHYTKLHKTFQFRKLYVTQIPRHAGDPCKDKNGVEIKKEDGTYFDLALVALNPLGPYVTETKNCPRDCVFSDWTPFSTCDPSTGKQTQTRTVLDGYHATDGGSCVGDLSFTQDCGISCVGDFVKKNTDGTPSTCVKTGADAGTQVTTYHITTEVINENKPTGVGGNRATACPHKQGDAGRTPCKVNCEGRWTDLTCDKEKGEQPQKFEIITQVAGGGKSCNFSDGQIQRITSPDCTRVRNCKLKEKDPAGICDKTTGVRKKVFALEIVANQEITKIGAGADCTWEGTYLDDSGVEKTGKKIVHTGSVINVKCDVDCIGSWVQEGTCPDPNNSNPGAKWIVTQKYKITQEAKNAGKKCHKIGDENTVFDGTETKPKNCKRNCQGVWTDWTSCENEVSVVDIKPWDGTKNCNAVCSEGPAGSRCLAGTSGTRDSAWCTAGPDKMSSFGTDKGCYVKITGHCNGESEKSGKSFQVGAIKEMTEAECIAEGNKWKETCLTASITTCHGGTDDCSDFNVKNTCECQLPNANNKCPDLYIPGGWPVCVPVPNTDTNVANLKDKCEKMNPGKSWFNPEDWKCYFHNALPEKTREWQSTMPMQGGGKICAIVKSEKWELLDKSINAVMPISGPQKKECPLDCRWVWDEWSECKPNLTRTRTSSIIQPAKGGGKPCNNPPNDMESCTYCDPTKEIKITPLTIHRNTTMTGADWHEGPSTPWTNELIGPKAATLAICIQRCRDEPDCKSVEYAASTTNCWGYDAPVEDNTKTDRNNTFSVDLNKGATKQCLASSCHLRALSECTLESSCKVFSGKCIPTGSNPTCDLGYTAGDIDCVCDSTREEITVGLSKKMCVAKCGDGQQLEQTKQPFEASCINILDCDPGEIWNAALGICKSLTCPKVDEQLEMNTTKTCVPGYKYFKGEDMSSGSPACCEEAAGGLELACGVGFTEGTGDICCENAPDDICDTGVYDKIRSNGGGLCGGTWKKTAGESHHKNSCESNGGKWEPPNARGSYDCQFPFGYDEITKTCRGKSQVRTNHCKGKSLAPIQKYSCEKIPAVCKAENREMLDPVNGRVCVPLTCPKLEEVLAIDKKSCIKKKTECALAYQKPNPAGNKCVDCGRCGHSTIDKLEGVTTMHSDGIYFRNKPTNGKVKMGCISKDRDKDICGESGCVDIPRGSVGSCSWKMFKTALGDDATSGIYGDKLREIVCPAATCVWLGHNKDPYHCPIGSKPNQIKKRCETDAAQKGCPSANNLVPQPNKDGDLVCAPCEGSSFPVVVKGIKECHKPCDVSAGEYKRGGICLKCNSTTEPVKLRAIANTSPTTDGRCELCPSDQGIKNNVCKPCILGEVQRDGVCVRCPVGKRATASGCAKCGPDEIVKNNECTKCGTNQVPEKFKRKTCVDCPELIDKNTKECDKDDDLCVEKSTWTCEARETCFGTEVITPDGRGCKGCDPGQVPSSKDDESCVTCDDGEGVSLAQAARAERVCTSNANKDSTGEAQLWDLGEKDVSKLSRYAGPFRGYYHFGSECRGNYAYCGWGGSGGSGGDPQQDKYSGKTKFINPGRDKKKKLYQLTVKNQAHNKIGDGGWLSHTEYTPELHTQYATKLGARPATVTEALTAGMKIHYNTQQDKVADVTLGATDTLVQCAERCDRTAGCIAAEWADPTKRSGGCWGYNSTVSSNTPTTSDKITSVDLVNTDEWAFALKPDKPTWSIVREEGGISGADWFRMYRTVDNTLKCKEANKKCELIAKAHAGLNPSRSCVKCLTLDDAKYKCEQIEGCRVVEGNTAGDFWLYGKSWVEMQELVTSGSATLDINSSKLHAINNPQTVHPNKTMSGAEWHEGPSNPWADNLIGPKAATLDICIQRCRNQPGCMSVEYATSTTNCWGYDAPVAKNTPTDSANYTSVDVHNVRNYRPRLQHRTRGSISDPNRSKGPYQNLWMIGIPPTEAQLAELSSHTGNSGHHGITYTTVDDPTMDCAYAKGKSTENTIVQLEKDGELTFNTVCKKYEEAGYVVPKGEFKMGFSVAAPNIDNAGEESTWRCLTNQRGTERWVLYANKTFSGTKSESIGVCETCQGEKVGVNGICMPCEGPTTVSPDKTSCDCNDDFEASKHKSMGSLEGGWVVMESSKCISPNPLSKEDLRVASGEVWISTLDKPDKIECDKDTACAEGTICSYVADDDNDATNDKGWCEPVLGKHWGHGKDGVNCVLTGNPLTDDEDDGMKLNAVKAKAKLECSLNPRCKAFTLKEQSKNQEAAVCFYGELNTVTPFFPSTNERPSTCYTPSCTKCPMATDPTTKTPAQTRSTNGLTCALENLQVIDGGCDLVQGAVTKSVERSTRSFQLPTKAMCVCEDGWRVGTVADVRDNGLDGASLGRCTVCMNKHKCAGKLHVVGCDPKSPLGECKCEDGWEKDPSDPTGYTKGCPVCAKKCNPDGFTGHGGCNPDGDCICVGNWTPDANGRCTVCKANKCGPLAGKCKMGDPDKCEPGHYIWKSTLSKHGKDHAVHVFKDNGYSLDHNCGTGVLIGGTTYHLTLPNATHDACVLNKDLPDSIKKIIVPDYSVEGTKTKFTGSFYKVKGNLCTDPDVVSAANEAHCNEKDGGGFSASVYERLPRCNGGGCTHFDSSKGLRSEALALGVGWTDESGPSSSLILAKKACGMLEECRGISCDGEDTYCYPVSSADPSKWEFAGDKSTQSFWKRKKDPTYDVAYTADCDAIGGNVICSPKCKKLEELGANLPRINEPASRFNGYACVLKPGKTLSDKLEASQHYYPHCSPATNHRWTCLSKSGSQVGTNACPKRSQGTNCPSFNFGHLVDPRDQMQPVCKARSGRTWEWICPITAEVEDAKAGMDTHTFDLAKMDGNGVIVPETEGLRTQKLWIVTSNEVPLYPARALRCDLERDADKITKALRGNMHLRADLSNPPGEVVNITGTTKKYFLPDSKRSTALHRFTSRNLLITGLGEMRKISCLKYLRISASDNPALRAVPYTEQLHMDTCRKNQTGENNNHKGTEYLCPIQFPNLVHGNGWSCQHDNTFKDNFIMFKHKHVTHGTPLAVTHIMQHPANNYYVVGARDGKYFKMRAFTYSGAQFTQLSGKYSLYTPTSRSEFERIYDQGTTQDYNIIEGTNFNSSFLSGLKYASVDRCNVNTDIAPPHTRYTPKWSYDPALPYCVASQHVRISNGRYEPCPGEFPVPRNEFGACGPSDSLGGTFSLTNLGDMCTARGGTTVTQGAAPVRTGDCQMPLLGNFPSCPAELPIVSYIPSTDPARARTKVCSALTVASAPINNFRCPGVYGMENLHKGGGVCYGSSRTGLSWGDHKVDCLKNGGTYVMNSNYQCNFPFRNTDATHTQLPRLVLKQSGDPQALKIPLGVGEGDCDKHENCEPGLKCFERNSQNRFEPIPGCRSGGSHDRSEDDYCYLPLDDNSNTVPCREPLVGTKVNGICKTKLTNVDLTAEQHSWAKEACIVSGGHLPGGDKPACQYRTNSKLVVSVKKNPPTPSTGYSTFNSTNMRTAVLKPGQNLDTDGSVDQTYGGPSEWFIHDHVANRVGCKLYDGSTTECIKDATTVCPLDAACTGKRWCSTGGGRCCSHGGYKWKFGPVQNDKWIMGDFPDLTYHGVPSSHTPVYKTLVAAEAAAQTMDKVLGIAQTKHNPHNVCPSCVNSTNGARHAMMWGNNWYWFVVTGTGPARLVHPGKNVKNFLPEKECCRVWDSTVCWPHVSQMPASQHHPDGTPKCGGWGIPAGTVLQSGKIRLASPATSTMWKSASHAACVGKGTKSARLAESWKTDKRVLWCKTENFDKTGSKDVSCAKGYKGYAAGHMSSGVATCCEEAAGGLDWNTNTCKGRHLAPFGTWCTQLEGNTIVNAYSNSPVDVEFKDKFSSGWTNKTRLFTKVSPTTQSTFGITSPFHQPHAFRLVSTGGDGFYMGTAYINGRQYIGTERWVENDHTDARKKPVFYPKLTEEETTCYKARYNLTESTPDDLRKHYMKEGAAKGYNPFCGQTERRREWNFSGSNKDELADGTTNVHQVVSTDFTSKWRTRPHLLHPVFFRSPLTGLPSCRMNSKTGKCEAGGDVVKTCPTVDTSKAFVFQGENTSCGGDPFYIPGDLIGTSNYGRHCVILKDKNEKESIQIALRHCEKFSNCRAVHTYHKNNNIGYKPQICFRSSFPGADKNRGGETCYAHTWSSTCPASADPLTDHHSGDPVCCARGYGSSTDDDKSIMAVQFYTGNKYLVSPQEQQKGNTHGKPLTTTTNKSDRATIFHLEFITREGDFYAYRVHNEYYPQNVWSTGQGSTDGFSVCKDMRDEVSGRTHPNCNITEQTIKVHYLQADAIIEKGSSDELNKANLPISFYTHDTQRVLTHGVKTPKVNSLSQIPEFRIRRHHCWMERNSHQFSYHKFKEGEALQKRITRKKPTDCAATPLRVCENAGGGGGFGNSAGLDCTVGRLEDGKLVCGSYYDHAGPRKDESGENTFGICFKGAKEGENCGAHKRARECWRGKCTWNSTMPKGILSVRSSACKAIGDHFRQNPGRGAIRAKMYGQDARVVDAGDGQYIASVTHKTKLYMQSFTIGNDGSIKEGQSTWVHGYKKVYAGKIDAIGGQWPIAGKPSAGPYDTKPAGTTADAAREYCTSSARRTSRGNNCSVIEAEYDSNNKSKGTVYLYDYPWKAMLSKIQLHSSKLIPNSPPNKPNSFYVESTKLDLYTDDEVINAFNKANWNLLDGDAHHQTKQFTVELNNSLDRSYSEKSIRVNSSESGVYNSDNVTTLSKMQMKKACDDVGGTFDPPTSTHCVLGDKMRKLIITTTEQQLETDAPSVASCGCGANQNTTENSVEIGTFLRPCPKILTGCKVPCVNGTCVDGRCNCKGHWSVDSDGACTVCGCNKTYSDCLASGACSCKSAPAGTTCDGNTGVLSCSTNEMEKCTDQEKLMQCVANEDNPEFSCTPVTNPAAGGPNVQCTIDDVDSSSRKYKIVCEDSCGKDKSCGHIFMSSFGKSLNPPIGTPLYEKIGGEYYKFTKGKYDRQSSSGGTVKRFYYDSGNGNMIGTYENGDGSNSQGTGGRRVTKGFLFEKSGNDSRSGGTLPAIPKKSMKASRTVLKKILSDVKSRCHFEQNIGEMDWPTGHPDKDTGYCTSFGLVEMALISCPTGFDYVNVKEHGQSAKCCSDKWSSGNCTGNKVTSVSSIKAAVVAILSKKSTPTPTAPQYSKEGGPTSSVLAWLRAGHTPTAESAYIVPNDANGTYTSSDYPSNRKECLDACDEHIDCTSVTWSKKATNKSNKTSCYLWNEPLKSAYDGDLTGVAGYEKDGGYQRLVPV